MTVVTETNLINSIATYEAQVVGIKNSFQAYQNPDSLTNAMLPAVLHFPESFVSDYAAHPGLVRTQLAIVSLLFVTPRQSMGGKLKFLENAAMPFLAKWRNQFQDATVIRTILSDNPSVQKFLLAEGRYTAGGLLNFNDIDYIGAVFRYQAIETN